MRVPVLMVIAALFLVPVNVVFAGGTCDDKDPVQITKLNNGQDLVVSAGEWVRLELPALGSAGYTWQITAHEPEFLKLVATETIDTAKPPIVGAPVNMVWCFQALKEGWTELNLDYFRPWEGAAGASDHFRIRVMIIRQEASK